MNRKQTMGVLGRLEVASYIAANLAVFIIVLIQGGTIGGALAGCIGGFFIVGYLWVDILRPMIHTDQRQMVTTVVGIVFFSLYPAAMIYLGTRSRTAKAPQTTAQKNEVPDVPRKTAQKEDESELPEEVNKLCSKYDAVTDWKQQLPEKDFLQHTYTIEVEDVLKRTDGRPVLFTGVVYDIVRESGKYVIYLSEPLSSLLGGLIFEADVRFVLDCTESQIEKIMNQDAKEFDSYAVIAQISEVEKIRFALTGHSSRDEDSEYVSVSLRNSDMFMAKGTCLDFLLIADEQRK